MRTRAIAVVVHYGDVAPTVTCVRSLVDAGLDVVLVDNGPTPGIAHSVAGLDRVEVLDPGANLGYAGGNNLGLRRAFERADYALVVNNDVTVSNAAFVEALIEALEDRPDAGIAGPLVHAPDGSVQPTIERLPSLRSAIALAIRKPPAPLPITTTEVEAVNGVCLLISVDAYATTGGFDERFFMYGEEVDLSKRAADAGYRTLFVPVPSIVHHHVHGEQRGDSATRIRVNFVRFCAEHRNALTTLLVAVWFLAGAVVRRRDTRRLAGELFTLVVDSALLPVLVSLWVVMLALGSAYSPAARHIGSVGKFLVLFLLVAVELAVVLQGPSTYLRRLRPGVLHAVTALVIAFAATSALWSPSPGHTLAYTAALGLLFAAVLLGPWRLVKEGGGERLAEGVLAGLTIVLVGNLLALLIQPHLAIVHPAGGGARFRGFFESPNEIGAYVLVAPLAAWRMVAPGSRRGRFLAGAVFGLLTLDVIASGTRSGVALLFAVILLLGAGYLGGSRLALGTLAVVVVVGIATTVLVLTPSIQSQSWWPASLRPGTFATLSGRTQAWSAAVHLTARRPFSGYGLGEEQALLELYRVEGELSFDECAAARSSGTDASECEALVPRSRRLIDFSGGYVHNSYLGLAIQLGAFVALLEVAVVVVAIGLLGGAVRARQPLGAALFAAAVTGAGWAIFSTYLWNPGNVVAGIFWLLLALGVARAGTKVAG